MSSGRGVRTRRAVPPVPGSSAVLVATAALADGGPAALQAWEGETLLARLVGAVREPRHRRGCTCSPGPPGPTRCAPPPTAPSCTRASRPPTTCARSAASPRARRARSWSPTPTSSPSARCWPACSQEPRIRTGVLTTGGPVARPYGFKTRARRGRIVSAGSPYHAVRKPTGTFLGVLKVAPADRPGVAAARPAARRARRSAARRLAGGARLQGRPLAAHARAVLARPRARRAGAAARGARRRSRSRPMTPPSSSAGARSRRTT